MREPLNRVRMIKSRILLLNEIISDFGVFAVVLAHIHVGTLVPRRTF